MKQFICVWTAPVYGDMVAIKHEDFFTEDNGYHLSDIRYIEALEVGHPHTVEPGHHVIRIKDDGREPVIIDVHGKQLWNT